MSEGIPLEQGLRQRPRPFMTISRSVRGYSIRTRIKTFPEVLDYHGVCSSEGIPLEQGLRRFSSSIGLTVESQRVFH